MLTGTGTGLVVFGAKGVIEDERPAPRPFVQILQHMRITKHIYLKQQPGHGKADFSETKHLDARQLARDSFLLSI